MQEVVSEKISDKEKIFNDLYKEYHEKVFCTCMGFLHNKEDAEYLVQEVFLEIHKSLDKFRGDSKVSTWLYRIAVNKSLNQIRKNKKNIFIKTFEILFDASSNGLNKEPSNNNTSKRMEDKELSKVLNTALNSLKETQRTAFVLSKYDELSYQEISEVMNVSLSSVESLIHRAKLNLQNKLISFYKI